MGYGTTVSLTISDCGGPDEQVRLVEIVQRHHARLSATADDITSLPSDERLAHICMYQAKNAVLFTLDQLIRRRVPIIEGSYAYAGVAFTTQFKNLDRQSYVALMSEVLLDLLTDDEFKFCHAYLITEYEQDNKVILHHFVMNEATRQPAITRTDIPNPGSYQPPRVQVSLSIKEIKTLFTLAQQANVRIMAENDGMGDEDFRSLLYSVVDEVDLDAAALIRQITGL